MANYIHFEIPGAPQAQKRHRTVTRGKGGRPLPYTRTYDPSESDKADFLALARDNAPEKPIDGPVLLGLLFRMPLPKGAPKYLQKIITDVDAIPMRSFNIHLLKAWGRDTEFIRVLHCKRPDVDNLVKMVKDALNGIYWRDDSQVQITGAIKVNSLRPRTEVIIRW